MGVEAAFSVWFTNKLFFNITISCVLKYTDKVFDQRHYQVCKNSITRCRSENFSTCLGYYSSLVAVKLSSDIGFEL